MKHGNFSSFLLLILMILLLASSQIAARYLASKGGEGKLINVYAVADESSFLNMETTESIEKLMGLEECENGDRECFNRRVLAEAHLDYIYTQHHKGP
ncbi:putative phytosulfokines 6 [Coffea eugenioides]|uniref:putative phytosulfokines 6 n=1 Tax=Coffea eugenioides TaxID=49369 RepID=UPI000F612BF0|nr:putative phytosulfokines 6 [Coffea eugenioides]